MGLGIQPIVFRLKLKTTMSIQDQKSVTTPVQQESSPVRKDESFSQDMLDAEWNQEKSSAKSSAPSFFSQGIADALNREDQWHNVQEEESPETSLKNQEKNQPLLQLDWAIALANSIMGLGIDLGLNEQQTPPQMSPREIATHLQQAAQHPDDDLRKAAISVIQAMNIPITEALSPEGIERICSHLSSL
jgi:hypothetical protein